MVVTGIVMECNPFHEGHQYILNEARRRTNADYVIVVLSGDYVQRGIPAIMNKEQRTHKVLEAGADLVLELPLPYATGAANQFAVGAMRILTGLRVVTSLAFGSLCADPDTISSAAALLDAEPPEYQELLRSLLAQGLSYPAAREQAAAGALGISLPTNGNDILGIEYVRALNKFNTHHSIEIHAIPRIITDSATTHRARMLQEQQDEINRSHIRLQDSDSPQDTCQENAATYYMRANDLSESLYYRLQSLTALSGITAIETAAEALMTYQDVGHDLACRILRLLPEFTTWEDYAARLKTRNVTYTRVSRALLHILLDIRREDVAAQESADTIGYTRVLGFRKTAGPLLTAIRNQSDIPLVTAPNAALANASIPDIFRRQLRRDLAASELYDQIQLRHTQAPHAPVCELTKPMIIIE